MGARQGVAKNLSKPQTGFYGWLVTRVMTNKNEHLEVNAVRLSNIQPNFTVLEVGFGPGVGLQHAYTYIKDGSGALYGTDISQKMINLTRDKFKQQIEDGKIHIHDYSVTDMGFESHMFDCVYHCNCYYFWPDMDKAVAELCRVMKPGSAIVATLNMKNIKILEKNSMMIGNTNPERYMSSLRKLGFTDVNIQDHFDEDAKQVFKAIHAKSPVTQ